MRFLFPFFGVWALVYLVALGFVIWMLVDAARRPESDFDPPQSRVWWIVGLAVGIFLNVIGLAIAAVYYFLVRKPLQEGGQATPLFKSSGPISSAPPRGLPGRTCRSCGEPLGTHAQYCQNCGTPVDTEG
jgi:hypothetical protein